MRIYSLIIWVLPALLSKNVAAQTPQETQPSSQPNAQPIFTFDGKSFVGSVSKDGSSVFDYNAIKLGKTFNWTQNTDEVDVLQVDLMNGKNESIVSWCSSPHTCASDGFSVNTTERIITLEPDVIEYLHNFIDAVLYFRLDWQQTSRKRAGSTKSTYSQEWAIVDGDEGDAVYSSYAIFMTAGADAYQTPGQAPTNVPSAVISSTTASSVASVSAKPPGSSSSKSKGLTTGAIVGIVVGCVGGLILISVVAGCLCFRRRRNAGADRGGSQGVQDIIAEKEARASIFDKDQPDTPSSERNSQNPLNRGLGMAGRNESGVELGIGQAVSDERCGNDRNSAVCSSLGGAANSAHGTPVIGPGAVASGSPTQNHPSSTSTHDRGSAMGSPVARASSQLDRPFSFYTDRAAAPQHQHDYSQHHHVVDGADLVQQEHSNDSTARSPSSVYSNPLDDLQPMSPDSAHENDGAAGAPQQQRPAGHARSTTPSGISGQYAHLVEEGMTNDEIRRLEEEERALDEAIEQAGAPARKR